MTQRIIRGVLITGKADIKSADLGKALVLADGLCTEIGTKFFIGNRVRFLGATRLQFVGVEY